MQSRTFLRIEGDLVSLVTEVTDREVTLPDLLTELTSSQLAITPRLPTGCRFWLRSGTTARCVFVVEQPPGRRTIEYHHGTRSDAEPVTYRLALPYVVFVVSTYGDQIESMATYFRTEPIGSLDDHAVLLDPAQHVRRRPRLSRIGQGHGRQRRRTGGRPDRRVLVQPLQLRPPAPPADRSPVASGPGRRVRGGIRSRPCPSATTRTGAPCARWSRRWPGSRSRTCRARRPTRLPQAETEVRTPDPAFEAGGDADALAS